LLNNPWAENIMSNNFRRGIGAVVGGTTRMTGTDATLPAVAADKFIKLGLALLLPATSSQVAPKLLSPRPGKGHGELKCT
jgi:hypothetical protein